MARARVVEAKCCCTADALSRSVRRVRCKALQTSSVASSTRRKPPLLPQRRRTLQVKSVRVLCPHAHEFAAFALLLSVWHTLRSKATKK
jgi:hypothetical protein